MSQSKHLSNQVKKYVPLSKLTKGAISGCSLILVVFCAGILKKRFVTPIEASWFAPFFTIGIYVLCTYLIAKIINRILSSMNYEEITFFRTNDKRADAGSLLGCFTGATVFLLLTYAFRLFLLD